jgi:glycosyltransferase involved in cell wall biosynthesis
MLPSISVVIPAFNEAAANAAAVQLALDAGVAEVVVADGGSEDGTATIAIDAGARVVRAARGRGTQLNAVSAASHGDVLLFVHADGRLPREAGHQIEAALTDPAVVGGNFSIWFGTGEHARFLAAFYDVIRQLTLYYGDSAIWCGRADFEAVGGFPPYPLMEDLKLVHRLRCRGQMAYRDGPVIALPRRWEQGGLVRTWTSWLVIQRSTPRTFHRGGWRGCTSTFSSRSCHAADEPRSRLQNAGDGS